MKKPLTLGIRSFLIVHLVILISACVNDPPATPETIPGIYLQTGYEFYRWEESLVLMIWHDGIKSSICESSTDHTRFSMKCHAISVDGHRFEWYLKTSDGETADFSINDQSFDLTEGNLFIIAIPGGELSISQFKRDLSKVAAFAEEVIEFGLADHAVRDFIQNQAKIKDCISSYDTSRRTPTDMDVVAARKALIDFFSYLHAGEYELAADLYRGSYRVMQDQNPGIDPEDHAALFQNACTINGAQCLEIRNATLIDQPSPAEFVFAVEFMNDDNSLFIQAPCCENSHENISRQNEFIYTTRLECTGKFRVLELPIYLP